jgi:2-(1,2-epoxy-1,2-dihydrophenyl)acetyl-CoA isomerase
MVSIKKGVLMKTNFSVNYDSNIFSSSMADGVVVVRQKQHIRNLTQDINSIFLLYDYLESILSSNNIKSIVIVSRPDNGERLEHSKFLCKALAEKREHTLIDRFANVVNKLILTLSAVNGITVYAGRGRVSLFHLNLSLACDYRIVADDTIFENLNADLCLITKGSGYFFPRLLGVKKASEVLQWKTFSAEDALQLGLIDMIVPSSKLEEETTNFVAASLTGSASTLIGIRKLLKCDMKELLRSLELEDLLIKERIESDDFKHVFAKYCEENFCSDIELLRSE